MARGLARRAAICLSTLSGLLSPAHAAQDVDGSHVAVLDNDTAPIDVPSTFYTSLHACPAACNPKADIPPWTIYTSVERLDVCNATMLLDFNVHNPIDDPDTVTKISACTMGAAPVRRRVDARGPACPSSANAAQSQVTMQLGREGNAANSSKAAALQDAFGRLETFLGNGATCDQTIFFAYAQGVAVGVYAGPAFDKSTLTTTFKAIEDRVTQSLPASAVFQLCGDGRNANHVLGVALDTSGQLDYVQKAVSSWTNAECVGDLKSSAGVPVTVLEADADINLAADNSTFADNPTASNTTLSAAAPVHLEARADCKTRTVVAGDSCGSLAKGCGISAADFTKYNPDKNLCSTLAVGQRVCCSAGTLPDITPKPNSDGTCAAYLVKAGDSCSTVAAANGLKNDLIEKYNNGTNGTWGWVGCGNIMTGMNICLSTGKPPMPAPVANAICGPTVPKTTKPTNGTNLADLNPCPLNACCNIWGQCGISGEFCVEKRGPSGNPGTAPPGVNGCVSSCGTDIKNKDAAPGSFGRVGYYESWNLDRPCLNLLAKDANTDGSYTHMHWAFVPIDSSFKPALNDSYKQWADFKALNTKRIASFGGWGYSTDPATYNALRSAMSAANRATFAANIAKFVSDEGLDGVDIDWEYPGAPDIPGIPPGKPDDGPNYLEFLKTLRSKLPAGKTISIAAPASYWYLKAFPIAKMADVLDYIVYMTYDLHGQWDTGNQYAMEGCLGGNCLRSHVNLTETMQVLSMITKAGVHTNKIFVGESSYGRSFGMSKAGCTGPDCTFEGDRTSSMAEPGPCTNTAGYISNAEINEIILGGGNMKTYHDGGSNSDILVYDDFNWVAYMTPTTKSTRRDNWKGYNFAGTIDWAVDLQDFTDDGFILDDNGDVLDWDSWNPRTVPPDMNFGRCAPKTYGTLTDLANDNSIDDNCRPLYILQFLQTNITNSLSSYDKLMKDGYDGKFNTYSKAVVSGAPKDVNDFVTGHGNDYFTCMVTEMQFCCSECKAASNNLPGGCTYCFKNGACEKKRRDIEGEHEERAYMLLDEALQFADPGTSPNPGLQLLSRADPPPGLQKHYNIQWTNISEPCPPDYSKRGLGQGQPQWDTVYWTMKQDKKDQFFADLFTAVGIKQDNIAFIDRHNVPECIPPSESAAECRYSDWDFGIPVPSGYDQSDVLNPKDTVSGAHDRLQTLPGQLSTSLDQMTKGSFSGNALDLVDALSMPIFMVSEALDQMNVIVSVADEIDREKRMAIIFAFLSAIFFFIPVAGEVAGSVAAMAGIARIAELIGAAGNSAMDIYTIVNDPANAPLAIFDLVLTPLSLGDLAMMAKAASARRGMSEGDVGKLGKTMKNKLDLIEAAKRTCKK